MSRSTEKIRLLEAVDTNSFTPRPYRYKFAVKDSNKLRDVKAHLNFWFVNFGLLSCYVVCGLVIAALGASIQDIASNIGYKSTEIASIYVSRGIGSIIGSFISAPIFTSCNAVRSLIGTYVLTIVVMLCIPIVPLIGLHFTYFAIGILTSVISSGSILLIRKIHKGHAGPWLGALGAALVSAGIIVPGVQMLFTTLWYQFICYATIIFLGLLWLRCLPHIEEDINNHDCEMCSHAPTNSFVNTYLVGSRAEVCYCTGGDESDIGTEYDTFFMTPVAAVSTHSCSSFYTSLDSIIHPEHEHMHVHPSHEDDSSLELEQHPHHHQNPQDDRMNQSGGLGRAGEEVFYYSHDEDEDRDEGLESLREQQQAIMDGGMEPPHYYSDFIISLMVLFIIGGGSAVSIFLETYVDITNVVDSNLKALVLMVLFVAGTVANVVGILVQINISDSALAWTTHGVLIFGALGMCLIVSLPSSPNALWVGIAAYGFASAITVGFCFNIANRLSFPSAKSTSIIMMGSSVGVSLIPYFTSHLIGYFDCPLMVIWIGLISMGIPSLLLHLAPRFSYLEGIHKF